MDFLYGFALSVFTNIEKTPSKLLLIFSALFVVGFFVGHGGIELRHINAFNSFVGGGLTAYLLRKQT